MDDTAAVMREMFRGHLGKMCTAASNPSPIEVGYAVIATFVELDEQGFPQTEEETEGPPGGGTQEGGFVEEPQDAESRDSESYAGAGAEEADTDFSEEQASDDGMPEAEADEPG